MSEKYFQMCDDLDIEDRWFLGSASDSEGNEIDPDSFSDGKRLAIAVPLTISLDQPGAALDFTFAAFDMPVVNSRALKVLYDEAPKAFQCFPARVGDETGEYFVINFIEKRRCVDEAKSLFLKWTERDARPDKIGEYRMFTRLRIRADMVDRSNAFRIEGWIVALIVSERIRRRMLDVGVTGARFVPV
jgi:hypothetical protein